MPQQNTYNRKILRQSRNEVTENIVNVGLLVDVAQKIGRRFQSVVGVGFDDGIGVVASKVGEKVLQVRIGELTYDTLVKFDLKTQTLRLN